MWLFNWFVSVRHRLQMRFVHNMQFVLIPAGTFTMGSPVRGNNCSYGETPHLVTLTKPFFIGRTVVTQGQWKKVMGTEPWKEEDYVQEGDDYPATFVTLEGAMDFCDKLSSMTGKTYRLPTEAEWEYACRGGTTTTFSFGDDEGQLNQYAWFDESWTDNKCAHAVAQKRPNAFGLYDMHGNVWEWCSDLYEEHPSTPVTDPQGASFGRQFVMRGGSWQSLAYGVRSSYRSFSFKDWGTRFIGFRVCRDL